MLSLPSGGSATFGPDEAGSSPKGLRVDFGGGLNGWEVPESMILAEAASRTISSLVLGMTSGFLAEGGIMVTMGAWDARAFSLASCSFFLRSARSAALCASPARQP